MGALVSEQPKAVMSEDPPSNEFRMQTSRLLVELQMYKKSAEVLESVVASDDSEIEAWYLLAFCKFRTNKYK